MLNGMFRVVKGKLCGTWVVSSDGPSYHILNHSRFINGSVGYFQLMPMLGYWIIYSYVESM